MLSSMTWGAEINSWLETDLNVVVEQIQRVSQLVLGTGRPAVGLRYRTQDAAAIDG